MRYGWLIGLLGLLTISSLFIGVSTIQVIDLLQFKGQSTQLFLATRLPRTVCLILAGATSSICGLIMQHLTQNKFVSPTTAGTMDSARLGILVVMLFLPNAPLLLRSFTAFLFAFGGTLLFLFLAQTLPQKNQLMLPLIGVMLGNIIGSIATFFAYRFTIVGLGESFAVNLGIDYKKMQLLGIGLVSLASAIVLIMVGSIPFLGVIIPNITARLYGDQVHKTIGITALLGSVFLLFCDIVARLVIYPYEIPVSVIVGIFGAIIFLYLLVRRKKYA
ncbi:ABC transporter permease [Enterococcus hirae]